MDTATNRASDTETTSGTLIAASKVNGTTVYNTGGEKLGSVYDVMLDKQTGNAAYAVMSFGGFLGIGEKYHPLPWKKLHYDIGLGGYVVDLDRRVLQDAPAYESGDVSLWGDDTWGGRVDDYYGIPRYDEYGRQRPGSVAIPPMV